VGVIEVESDGGFERRGFIDAVAIGGRKGGEGGSRFAPGCCVWEEGGRREEGCQDVREGKNRVE